MSLCPVCRKSVEGPPSHSYTVQEAAAHFCAPTTDSDRYERMLECLRRLWRKDACNIKHCNDCGFGFAEPYIAGDETFYAILHERHGYPRWRWDYEVALNSGIGPTDGGNILDIGAGDGVFLRALGSCWHKYAIEGSPTTRELLRSHGIQVFDRLRDALCSNLKFEAITMFQVLEHVAPFWETLEGCRDLLTERGIIIITVPDAKAMRTQEMFTGCPDMPPNHVNKWTPASLTIALKTSDLTVHRIVVGPPSFAKLIGLIHLRLLADRAKPRSWAEKVYCLSGKQARLAGLAILAGPALIRLSPHLPELWRGGAFAAVAGRPQ